MEDIATVGSHFKFLELYVQKNISHANRYMLYFYFILIYPLLRMYVLQLLIYCLQIWACLPIIRSLHSNVPAIHSRLHYRFAPLSSLAAFDPTRSRSACAGNERTACVCAWAMQHAEERCGTPGLSV